jgi:hypothetical protein
MFCNAIRHLSHNKLGCKALSNFRMSETPGTTLCVGQCEISFCGTPYSCITIFVGIEYHPMTHQAEKCVNVIWYQNSIKWDIRYIILWRWSNQSTTSHPVNQWACVSTEMSPNETPGISLFGSDQYDDIWDTQYIIICEYMRHLLYHLWVMDTSIYETPAITLFVSDGYVNIWDTRYNSVIRAIVWCATRIVSPLRC